ncbi:hypothetical protein SUGI_0221380 [Cryptomeria japonica]|uniref:glutaredoxin-C1-like n=1 Tax=Cryptomeria japonica TaxID=3369 RepID=UPI002408A4A2|nr:glutaredoxin-C1-like [Cryptomeria japonica]GLJ13855.1 hypothetical protein SUGI_0221380 [Cryptomeria japonica]
MAWIFRDDSRWVEVVYEAHAYQSSENKFSMDQLRGFWGLQRVQCLASESAVAIFSISSCCMCHVAKRLLLELGVSPTVYELDQENGGEEMHKVLLRLLGTAQSVPAVFIGGKLVGGLEQLITCHISGSLVLLLKESGALWL